LVDEPAVIYRGPLLVWGGFFTAFFFVVVVDLGMFCVFVVVTGTWVLPGVFL